MIAVSSHPASHVQNSGEKICFPTMNSKLHKPQIDYSRRSNTFMKQNSQLILPACSVSQPGGYPGKDMPVSAISQTDGNEFQSSPVMPPILQSKELSPIGIPAVIEIPRLPFSQHFTYNVFTQTESKVFQSNLPDISFVMEKEQAKVMPALDYAVRDHFLDVNDSKNAFNFQVHSIQNSVDLEGETCELVKNEILSSSRLSKCIAEYAPKDGAQINQGHKAGDGNKHVLEMKDFGGSCLPHSAEISGGIGYSLTNTTVQPCSLSALVDESKPTARSVTSLIAGKLWDGTLQLSASTIVSAVAFFKSGEKASETNWSQYIEVKGKVRLEAFEKFIQELPRSRSRALMVISLCWKVGSSETGLTSMKEIAKIYKEGQKVGYAQLCAGTDLYVCPRNETIITILAKYGFFKGMAAVEEDRDSLIGCVVWRRNFDPSSAKAMESKKLSSGKSSDFSMEESGRLAAEAVSRHATTLEFVKSQSISRSEDNACKPSPVPPICLNVSKNKIMPTLNSSIDPTITVDSKDDSSINSVFTATENPVKYDATFPPTVPPVGAPTSYLSVPMKPDSDVKVKRPLQKVEELSQVAQNKHSSSDDDDLPEFDFDAACGPPRALKGEPSLSIDQTRLNVVEHNEQLSVEKAASLPEASKASKKILSFKVSHFPSARPVINTHSKAGKVGDHFREEAAALTTAALSKPTTKRESGVPAAQGFNIHSHQKKIWDASDDDDDMPEWCPPDIDIENLPSPPPKLPHRIFYPSDLGQPEARSRSLPRGPSTVSQLGPHQPGSEHYQEKVVLSPRVSRWRQHQRGSEQYQERTVLPSPEPSRLPDQHVLSPPVSRWHQHQQVSEQHQERTMLPSPRPLRLPDHRVASGHAFSQHPSTMSKYSPIVDRSHQIVLPQMPSVHNRQPCEDSPPWSPSCRNRFRSPSRHDRMSPYDQIYVENRRHRRHSPENVSGRLPGSHHGGRSSGKPDRYYDKHHNETSRGWYTDSDLEFDPPMFSTKHESSRCRSTGFDVMPTSPRPTTHGRSREHDQYPRRRPSLFDVKPRDRSNHR